MRAQNPIGGVLQRGDRLDQAFLIHFFLVQTGVVQKRGEEIDEEIANHCTHDVHHEGDGNEWTQNTHYCRKHHKTNIEIFQMVVLHLLHIQLEQSCPGDLESTRKNSNPSEKIRNFNDKHGPFVKVAVDQSFLALQSRNSKPSEKAN